MTIKYVILGFLSETPLTGYDLKKKFSSSEIFHWSGNNNQIYRALVELHDEHLATLEVQYQESKPPRKIYQITDEGRAVLRQWMQSTPELPQMQNALLMQLTWADQLEPDALKAMLANYEEALQLHLMMLREQSNRNRESQKAKLQTPAFKERVSEHWIAFYELELAWVRGLRAELDES